MSDIFLFMKLGWKNLWKPNIIWLFSLLSVVSNFTNIILRNQDDSLSTQFISLIVRFLLISLYYIGSIGYLYLAYSFLIGEPATIQQTWQAVKKFAGRIIGSDFLFFLMLSPLFCCGIVYLTTVSDVRPIQLSDQLLLALSPIAIFNSMWDFIRLGFFSNDLRIKSSISNAWNIFTTHFIVLATLGIIISAIGYASSVISGIITLLFQYSFDVTHISKLNFYNPVASLYDNLLFLTIQNIFSVMLNIYSAFLFVLAYLKYNKENNF